MLSKYVPYSQVISVYAIRLLCFRGLTGVRLQDIVRAITMSRIMYASPAWFGFTNESQRARINAVFKKLIRYGYLPNDQLLFENLNDHADRRLFLSALYNPGHVLHNLLPPVRLQIILFDRGCIISLSPYLGTFKDEDSSSEFYTAKFDII